MSKAQFSTTLAVVAVTGLLGGALSDRLRSQPAWAQEGAAAAKVVEAREFRLVDDAGRLRASLSLDPEGRPGLTLWDDASKSRVELGCSSNGSHLSLVDDAGTYRASLNLASDGRPGLQTWDEAGKLRSALGHRADDSPGITLLDDTSQSRVELGLPPRGPHLSLVDDAGKLRAWIAFDPDGRPGIAFLDGDGLTVWRRP